MRQRPHIYIYIYIYLHFNSHFPGEPGLAGLIAKMYKTKNIEIKLTRPCWS